MSVNMNKETLRFEMDEQGQTVFADYRMDENGEFLIITHVEAPPVLRGTGAAGNLMRQVCETARDKGWKINPLCGYAATWINRHHEYKDLLV